MLGKFGFVVLSLSTRSLLHILSEVRLGGGCQVVQAATTSRCDQLARRKKKTCAKALTWEPMFSRSRSEVDAMAPLLLTTAVYTSVGTCPGRRKQPTA